LIQTKIKVSHQFEAHVTGITINRDPFKIFEELNLWTGSRVDERM